MADLTIEQMSDEMYKLVKDGAGMKKYKAGDLVKALKELHPGVDKKAAKDAVKLLVDSGRCVYTYFGGSFVELPHKEAASND